MFRCNVKLPSLHAFFVAFLCLCAYLQPTALAIPLQGKEISISVRKTSLPKILYEISEKSGITISFVNADLSMYNDITYEAKNKEVKNILAELLKDKGLQFEIISEKQIGIRKSVKKDSLSFAPADTAITIRGKVMDENGIPLPGANIIVKGLAKGAATSNDGSFIINNVKASARLAIVSMIGYETVEQAITSSNFINVRLKPAASNLDETIVIGYGQSSRRIYTGNVSSITADVIEKQPVNNPLLALQGRIPGMTIVQQSGLPGATMKIQIRGQSSINGSEPLYIVDGVPIDPNILGGPTSLPRITDNNRLSQTPVSAFSLINPNDIESIDVLKDADATSIYGSRGANGVILITTKKGKSGKTKISVNYSNGIGKVTRHLDLLNTRQYLDMRYEAYRNDGVTIPAFPIFNNYDLTVYDSSRYTDWQKELLGGTARFRSIQASLSGGSMDMQYFLSANVNKETNVSPGKFENTKGNVHLSISGAGLHDKLKMQLGATYLIDNNDLPSTDYTAQAMTLAPNSPKLFMDNGELNWAQLPDGRSTWSNPLARSYAPYEMNNNNLITNALLSYEVFPGLILKTTGGYNITQSQNFEGTIYAAIRPENRATTARSATFFNQRTQAWILEPQMNFERVVGFGNLAVLVGGSFQKNSRSSITTRATGFSSDESIRNLGSATNFNAATSSSEYLYSALFGRINYNINNKYIANINLRRDGSSRFGPGNQFGNFYSVGAAYIFSDENWIKDKLSLLSYGKVRASYGTTGNDQIPDYRYLKLYNYTFNNYQDIKALNIEGLYDGYFAWEVTKKLEFGLELGFFKDRLQLSGSVYRNRSSNQLLAATLPVYLGPGSIQINRDALVQNTGLELLLTTTNLQRRNLSWKTGFNISFNRNKLIKYPNIEETTDDYLLDVGEPLNRQRVFSYAGVDASTGVYVFHDKTGKKVSDPIDPDDKTNFINSFPDYFGGLQNSLTIGSFSLDFLFQFVKQKGRNYISGIRPGAFNGVSIANQPTSVLDRWTQSGDVKPIQRFSQNSSVTNSFNLFQESNAYYTDASYIRLKNISLSYNVSGWLKERIKYQSLRILLSAQNLLTFTNYKGLDPESQNSMSLPPLTTATIGIQLVL